MGITIMPTADSLAPNDVHIIATQGSTKVGEDSMTIVGVTFTTSEETISPEIRSVDTPLGMEDRIPPQTPTALYLTVSPNLSETDQFVTLNVTGQTQRMVP
jgi:hypothetical protein